MNAYRDNHRHESLLPVKVQVLAALLLLALFIGLVLLLGGCGREEGGQVQGALRREPGQNERVGTEPPVAPATAQAQAPQAPQTPPAPVEVLRLRPQDFNVSATYIGNLVPNERVALRSEIEGVAEQVRFEESGQVAKSEVLVHISTSRLTAQRDLAKANYELAESNLRRSKDLSRQNLIPQSKLDEAQTSRDVAYYNLKLAQIELDKSIIKAPISGVVKTKSVAEGEFVNKGEPLAEILDMSAMLAAIDVPERDIRFVKPGQTVRVTLDALPDRSFAGRVDTVGLEADPRNRSFPVEVRLENPNRALRPGMLARVEVVLQSYEHEVLVPRHAILEREHGKVAFVAEDGRARLRTVRTGASTAGAVQVLEGLSLGEQLIVTGHQRLSDQEPIDIRAELTTFGEQAR